MRNEWSDEMQLQISGLPGDSELILKCVNPELRALEYLEEEMWTALALHVAKKVYHYGYFKFLTLVQCSGALAGMRSIPAQYRMTNKPTPTRHTPFLSAVLRPASSYLEQYSELMDKQVS